MKNIEILPNGTVKLNLPFETRYIGKIISGTYIKKISENEHFYRKNNSVAFNADLIENGQFDFINVIIIGSGNMLQTTRKYVLRYGLKHTFKKKGFEQQIFLPLELFGLDKAEKYEKELRRKKQKQLSLFA